jgi:transposase
VITDSADSKPANEAGVITDFIGPCSQKQPLELPPPNHSASACEPHRETIELGLSRGRNAMSIWQDMVTANGFAGGYQTVQRFVRKLRGSQGPEPVGIIVTAPGEECQVDYGTGPMVRDPQTVLPQSGYSRKASLRTVQREIDRDISETQSPTRPR